MSRNVKSFLRLFAVMAIVAVLLSALPTVAEVDKNQQAQFCLLIDGRELLREGTGDCVLDIAAIVERFLLYFAFLGGTLLGPFGLYVVLVGVKMGLTGGGRRREQGREKD